MEPDPDYKVQFSQRSRMKLRLLALGLFLILAGLAVLKFGPPGAPYGIAIGVWGIVLLGVAFGIYWRCPKCDRYLGRDFKHHCPSCGTLLKDKTEPD